LLSLQKAPGTGSFCRLHTGTTVTQGSSSGQIQLNRPLEPKPSIARLTRMASSVAVSSSPSPRPALNLSPVFSDPPGITMNQACKRDVAVRDRDLPKFARDRDETQTFDFRSEAETLFSVELRLWG